MRETLTVIRADCLAATTEWLPSKGKTAVRLNRLMGPAIGGWQAAHPSGFLRARSCARSVSSEARTIPSGAVVGSWKYPLIHAGESVEVRVHCS